MESYDQYQERVLSVMKDNVTLDQQNIDLSKELTEAVKEKNKLQKTLVERESDIEKLSDQVMKHVEESAAILTILKQYIADKKKISEIQYELDICLSCKRSLERDCMLQKNENQRLTCLNNRLSQELKTLKPNQLH